MGLSSSPTCVCSTPPRFPVVCIQLYRRWNTCFHFRILTFMHMYAQLRTIKPHYTEVCVCALQKTHICMKENRKLHMFVYMNLHPQQGTRWKKNTFKVTSLILVLITQFSYIEQIQYIWLLVISGKHFAFNVQSNSKSNRQACIPLFGLQCRYCSEFICSNVTLTTAMHTTKYRILIKCIEVHRNEQY